MTPWLLRAAPGMGALIGIAAGVAMSLPPALAGEALPAPQAREWLSRMHVAATQRNYQGTLVVSSADAMSSSRVLHYCDGRQSWERVDLLDGPPRRLLRHNDQVLTLWPAAKVAQLDQREPVAAFPTLHGGADERVFERYEMRDEGRGRVAGHDARIFLLRPLDGARFAQRLWAEQGSGLLLRADVLAPDGRVLETSAFSELSIGGKTRPEAVAAVLRQLEGWRVHKSKSQPTTLEAEGWQLKAPVAGFRQASCVKRHLSPDQGDGAPPVLQVIFGDGLTHVSLFIEPHRPERHRAGAVVTGATHTWMQAVGEHWVTAMGDLPLATLKQFVAALERRR